MQLDLGEEVPLHNAGWHLKNELHAHSTYPFSRRLRGVYINMLVVLRYGLSDSLLDSFRRLLFERLRERLI
jgi:hypothetical protein